MFGLFQVMMTNVITSAFDGVSTVEAGVELLEAFHRLAKRDSMKHIVERKTSDVYQMFIRECQNVKKDFDYNHLKYVTVKAFSLSLFLNF